MINAKHRYQTETNKVPIDVGHTKLGGLVLLRVFGTVLELTPHDAERMAASLLEQARAVRS